MEVMSEYKWGAKWDPYKCVIDGCSSNSMVSEDRSIRFFSLPSIIDNGNDLTKDISTRRRIAWCIAINRQSISMQAGDCVCSRHFANGRPALLLNKKHIDWIPNQNLPQNSARNEMMRYRNLRTKSKIKRGRPKRKVEHGQSGVTRKLRSDPVPLQPKPSYDFSPLLSLEPRASNKFSTLPFTAESKLSNNFSSSFRQKNGTMESRQVITRGMIRKQGADADTSTPSVHQHLQSNSNKLRSSYMQSTQKNVSRKRSADADTETPSVHFSLQSKINKLRSRNMQSTQRNVVVPSLSSTSSADQPRQKCFEIPVMNPSVRLKFITVMQSLQDHVNIRERKDQSRPVVVITSDLSKSRCSVKWTCHDQFTGKIRFEERTPLQRFKKSGKQAAAKATTQSKSKLPGNNQNHPPVPYASCSFIPIRCNSVKGILHRSKFHCPGLTHKCVMLNNSFVTLEKFMKMSGEDPLLDWASHITLSDDTTLGNLLNSGMLDFTDHSTFCSLLCRKNSLARGLYNHTDLTGAETEMDRCSEEEDEVDVELVNDSDKCMASSSAVFTSNDSPVVPEVVPESANMSEADWCCAPNCRNGRMQPECQGMSFFSFPMEESRCKLWVQYIDYPELMNSTSSEIYETGLKLCSIHFKEDQFTVPGESMKLNSDAVPTIFPGPAANSDESSNCAFLRERKTILIALRNRILKQRALRSVVPELNHIQSSQSGGATTDDQTVGNSENAFGDVNVMIKTEPSEPDTHLDNEWEYFPIKSEPVDPV